ncbi:MAG TPA: ABC transporter ATP-binding protein [Casimicrobiaceae bacterium]|nr:ABC transporter ATP-binding protein [Casimicrobiaceae bacterium]
MLAAVDNATIGASQTSATGAFAIEVDGLAKAYRLGEATLVALDDVSFRVRDGEFVSLVGPSGCGKSTLLNIVAGLVSASAGEVRVRGSKMRGPSRSIGMMFQSPVLLPWRTNLDNVLLPIEVFRLDREHYVSKALAFLRLVGLDAFAHRYPFELSGGMQQRVAICRMLLYDPAVLLMDEPFSALDEMSREFLNLELLRIWEEFRKTVMFVTHNIGEAVFLADRVVVMSARPGRVARIVPIDLPRPRSKATLESDAFFHQVTAIRKELDELRS